MAEQVMVAVRYNRVPKTESYKVNVNVIKVSVEGDVTAERILRSYVDLDISMESMIVKIHNLLQKYPKAKVTMLRGTTRPTHFGQTNPKGFELDEETRDLIRDDLGGAKKMFAPIERTAVAKE